MSEASCDRLRHPNRGGTGNPWGPGRGPSRCHVVSAVRPEGEEGDVDDEREAEGPLEVFFGHVSKHPFRDVTCD
jgi:hypothetical protein